MEENKKKAIILTLIAVSCLLVVVIGAAYAYFQVLSSNNVSTTNTQGQTDTMPKGTLVTNRDAVLLKINLDANLMKKENENTTYYATPSGTPVTVATEGSGKYVLATASLDKEGLVYDCTYSYKVTAIRKNAISDGSDADVKVKIIGSNGYEETYTLAELVKKEEIYTGKIKRLTYGENQKIYIEAYVENTNKPQDDLAGNSFTFTIELVDNSFKCDLPISEQAKGKEFAQFLVDNNTKIDSLWQSGLEGDGYRYIGSGNYDSETTPDNFICFGTNDKTECKNNEAKYMYRIIGVFPDSSGKQHLKLISFKQLGKYEWNDTNVDIDWGSSTLFTSLNGSGFLTNSTYDYMQNATWLNKIEDWQWTAVNTKSAESSGPSYYNGVTTKQMYLHEMNRIGKSSSVGAWTTPSAKIGLMYASDYQMCLGSSSLSYTGTNSATLKTGWMHQSNNDKTKSTYEWTLPRFGRLSSSYIAWDVSSTGGVDFNHVTDTYGVRPVFHLTSDTKIMGGNGRYSNPYILAE